MLSIRFYNERGQILFVGGGPGKWRLTAADGLALPGRTFKSVRYQGQAGQETTETVVNPRTITLSGDVETDGKFPEEYSKTLAILEKEGTIEVRTSLGKRKIGARCCEFYQGEKKGRFMLFVVQFLCDNPYFESMDKTEVPIFKEIPLLDKNFVFPGSFSGRISRKNLVYPGSAETEPVLFINVEDGADGDNLLSIVNHTSGESLRFNYGATKNDSVTVDIKNRVIYNSKGEDLLEYLTDDSFFDGFHLYPGENDIEVINRNMNTGICVTCSYSDRYAEAVHI